MKPNQLTRLQLRAQNTVKVYMYGQLNFINNINILTFLLECIYNCVGLIHYCEFLT